MYKQNKHPFPITSCGRRRSNMMTGGSPLERSDSEVGQQHVWDGPLNRVRKTTKGKGRNFRSAEEGAGMTSTGVKKYKAENPGSKLKTAVTGKVKAGSKDAGRRKSFCARSKGWDGERGKAARARWKC